MPPPPPPRPVRSLRPDQDVAAAAVLSRAFEDDPNMAHLLPDDASRVRRMQHLFEFAIADGRRRGLVHTTDDLAAVTVWHAPGRHGTSALDALRALPSMLRTFPPGRIPTAAKAFDLMERKHPHEPHWYLGIIGSDPAQRGTGAGKALLEPVLAMLDEEGSPAYLESSKLANVPYYERFGFRVTEEVSVPDDGPMLYLMWRDPQPT